MSKYRLFKRYYKTYTHKEFMDIVEANNRSEAEEMAYEMVLDEYNADPDEQRYEDVVKEYCEVNLLEEDELTDSDRSIIDEWYRQVVENFYDYEAEEMEEEGCAGREEYYGDEW